jgi:hypothetical protein
MKYIGRVIITNRVIATPKMAPERKVNILMVISSAALSLQ